MQENIVYLNEDWWNDLKFENVIHKSGISEISPHDHVRLTSISSKVEQLEIFWNEGGITGISVQGEMFGSESLRSEKIYLAQDDELDEVEYEQEKFGDSMMRVVKFPEFRTKLGQTHGPYPKESPVNYGGRKIVKLQDGWQNSLIFADKCEESLYGKMIEICSQCVYSTPRAGYSLHPV